jgi:hypothetical protein
MFKSYINTLKVEYLANLETGVRVDGWQYYEDRKEQSPPKLFLIKQDSQ